MNTTLVIFFLNVQSSYSGNTEEPATDQEFDTIQFFESEGGAWRIKTYAKDQDVHVWSLGNELEDIVSLARSNTEKHYGDVLRAEYVLTSTVGVDGLPAELAERGLSNHLEISGAGFAFWAPDGTRYRSKSTPAPDARSPVVAADGSVGRPPGRRITAPSDDDLTRLAKAAMTASDLVSRHVGTDLDTSEADLDRLQQLLDRGALRPADRHELRCLGVAFGRVIVANVEGLDWAIIDDEYGRDPTLRYRESSLTINVLTMISKRIEDGRIVDVRELYDLTREHLVNRKHEVD